MAGSPGETKVEDVEDLNEVQAEIVSAPAELQPPDSSASGPWIQYNGIATLRILSERDWKVIGTEGVYCEWNHLNNRRLPKSNFNEKQLHYLLNVDGDFTEVSE